MFKSKFLVMCQQKERFSLVALFNVISAFMCYFISKPFRRKIMVLFNPKFVNKKLHTFPKVIYLKMNLIAWLEFKLAMMSQSISLFTRPQRFPYRRKKDKDINNTTSIQYGGQTSCFFVFYSFFFKLTNGFGFQSYTLLQMTRKLNLQ